MPAGLSVAMTWARPPHQPFREPFQPGTPRLSRLTQ
jgi:hypothetical protein